LKNFHNTSEKKGVVLTTPTSGSTDLFVIQEGKVLIFVPNQKVNEKYSINFVMLTILKESDIFNESSCLFEKDSMYGTLVIKDNTKLFSLEKQAINLVTDTETIETMRAN